MTPEGAPASAHDHRARLEEALADNANLRRLASSVAHDFNNLLAVITGYVELMLGRLRPNDPLRRNAESIKKAAEWGAALAQQILAGSRRQPPPATPVDLNQLVTNVTRVLQPLLGESIELVTRLDPELGRVRVNQYQIGQVIMNLVVNARDAMPGGGLLTIETANVVQGVMLSVSDTGSGMDAETRARLFEPYFTTKDPGRGTGLGLATVDDVVTRAGGQISVSSDAGRGSTFRISLPRVDEPRKTADAPAVVAGSAAGQSAGARTVLLVEDERDVRELIREILQLQDYGVLEARDRHEALALSERYSGTIDLVIAEVVMPPSATDALVERMMAARPGIKVLYVSGYLDDERAAPRLGPVLQKPFTVQAFTEMIREVLNGGT